MYFLVTSNGPSLASIPKKAPKIWGLIISGDDYREVVGRALQEHVPREGLASCGRSCLVALGGRTLLFHVPRVRTPDSIHKKRPRKNGAFFYVWRRGRDSNPR